MCLLVKSVCLSVTYYACRYAHLETRRLTGAATLMATDLTMVWYGMVYTLHVLNGDFQLRALGNDIRRVPTKPTGPRLEVDEQLYNP